MEVCLSRHIQKFGLLLERAINRDLRVYLDRALPVAARLAIKQAEAASSLPHPIFRAHRQSPRIRVRLDLLAAEIALQPNFTGGL
jgi:hypothetical protein